MKMLKSLVVLALIAFCIPQFASAVSVNRTKKSVAAMRDSSGYPVYFNDDKPWKVFEVKDTVTPALIVDEAGVAPAQGMIKRICLESAPAIPVVADNVIVWDTSVANTVTVSGAGRRIVPPIQRASGVEKCVEINALFSLGAAVMNGVSTGSVYVYWRELGGYR